MMITREPVLQGRPESFIQRLGHSAFVLFSHIGRSCLISFRSIGQFVYLFGKRSRHEFMVQLYTSGIRSLGVVSIVALFTGMIFALQTGLELRRFGQEAEIGGAVAVVMLREMGPFMASLIVAASYGSSVAAQLGTMTVSEEIAALEIMAIDPVKFLVMPRMAALLIIMPLLAFYTTALAMFGGALVGKAQLGVAYTAYFDAAFYYAENKDLWVGLFKALVFGFIICTVSCYQGFITKGGAVGVGLSTRKTVVVSFVTVLVVGYIITRLFYS